MQKLFKTKEEIISNALTGKIEILEKMNAELTGMVNKEKENNLVLCERVNGLMDYARDYVAFKKYKQIKDDIDKKVETYLSNEEYDFDFYEYKEILEKYNINSSDMNRLDEIFKAVKLNNDEFVLDVVSVQQERIEDLLEEIEDLEEDY